MKPEALNPRGKRRRDLVRTAEIHEIREKGKKIKDFFFFEPFLRPQWIVSKRTPPRH